MGVIMNKHKRKVFKIKGLAADHPAQKDFDKYITKRVEEEKKKLEKIEKEYNKQFEKLSRIMERLFNHTEKLKRGTDGKL